MWVISDNSALSALAEMGLKAGIGAALAGGAAAMGVGVKAVNSAADFEQTKSGFLHPDR